MNTPELPHKDSNSIFDDSSLTFILEDQVNSTNTSGNQITPDVAYVSHDVLVYTWASENSDGTNDIYARMFNQSGDPLGAEFLVNSDVSGDFAAPEVVVIGSGYFYVTWNEMEELVPGFDDLQTIASRWAKAYHVSGATAVDAFEYTLEAAPDLRLLRNVELFADDTRAVATQLGGTYDPVTNYPIQTDVNIYVLDLETSSTIRGWTSATTSGSSEWEAAPYAIPMADGGFLLLYQLAAGSSNTLVGQRYDEDGDKQGSRFTIATGLEEAAEVDPENMDAATLADGTYVVVWQSQYSDSQGGIIFGQRFDANNNKIGETFTVNQTTEGGQINPDVTALENGGYAITWQTANLDGSGYGIATAFYEIPNYPSSAIVGGTTADSLTGTNDADYFLGDSGNDTIQGLLGNDTIFAGEGHDNVTGDGGNDTLHGENGNDTLDGGAGSDRLYGGTHNDNISGGAGNDVIYGDHGADTLDGGDGTDAVQYLASGTGVTVDLSTGLGSAGQAAGDVLSNIENINGSRASDHLIGDDGNNKFVGYGGWDTLEGGAGDDRLEGWRGKDVLDGGDGDDYLFGGTEEDTLTGGAGNDTLVGGTQADLFIFEAGSGEDVITDFNAGLDRLDLSTTATDFTDLASLQAAASEVDGGILIDLGGGDTLLLQGLTLGDLSGISIVF